MIELLDGEELVMEKKHKGLNSFIIFPIGFILALGIFLAIYGIIMLQIPRLFDQGISMLGIGVPTCTIVIIWGFVDIQNRIEIYHLTTQRIISQKGRKRTERLHSRSAV